MNYHHGYSAAMVSTVTPRQSLPQHDHMTMMKAMP
jgi:hypothetical protein